MTKRVHFAKQRINNKEKVLCNVKVYEVDELGKHRTREQDSALRASGREIRGWINRSEKHLRVLKKNIAHSETLADYEKYLGEYIKTMEYQLNRIKEHKELCEKGNRISIYSTEFPQLA
tara:strand:- start:15 stop:371 length:357 start_codon:yes stop_codon:yes gene_type:complete